MKKIFFRTVYSKIGKKFDYFIEFEDEDVEKVKKGEITVDSITNFTFGILCTDKKGSSSISFTPKEIKEFGDCRVFFEECFEVNVSSVISRQISGKKR